MHAYVLCRMDIGYAISNLAKHSDAPAECHYLALKRIFRYLRQTLTWGSIYWRQQHRLDLDPGDPCIYKDTAHKTDFVFPYQEDPYDYFCCVDAAHANNLDTRRSTTSIVDLLGSTAVLYKSKRQTTVATSSTDS